MERIKEYLYSLSKLLLLVAAVLSVVSGFSNIWETYQIERKCDETILVRIEDYRFEEQENDYPIGYPIVHYEIDEKEYMHESMVEIGTYPYDKLIKTNLKYSSYDPSISILEIEVKEALYTFAVHICIAVILILIRVGVGIYEIYHFARREE